MSKAFTALAILSLRDQGKYSDAEMILARALEGQRGQNGRGQQPGQDPARAIRRLKCTISPHGQKPCKRAESRFAN